MASFLTWAVDLEAGINPANNWNLAEPVEVQLRRPRLLLERGAHAELKGAVDTHERLIRFRSQTNPRSPPFPFPLCQCGNGCFPTACTTSGFAPHQAQTKLLGLATVQI